MQIEHKQIYEFVIDFKEWSNTMKLEYHSFPENNHQFFCWIFIESIMVAWKKLIR